MRPDPVEPSLDEHGDETHPAWATIKASRTTGGEGILFDSDVVHHHTMRVTISRATRKRELKHDWIHGQMSTEYIEVEMSEAQWGAFVSTPNSGTGTPCTLRYKDGEAIPGMPHDPRLALNLAEARKAAAEAYKDIAEAFETLEALINNKAPMRGSGGQREALRNLHFAIRNAVPNVEFASKRLIEQTEDVVQKAKYDVEAFVINKARQLGIDAAELELGQPDMLALPSSHLEAED